MTVLTQLYCTLTNCNRHKTLLILPRACDDITVHTYFDSRRCRFPGWRVESSWQGRIEEWVKNIVVSSSASSSASSLDPTLSDLCFSIDFRGCFGALLVLSLLPSIFRSCSSCSSSSSEEVCPEYLIISKLHDSREPFHRGVCTLNLPTRGFKNIDDVTLLPIFSAEHEGLCKITFVIKK